MINIKLVGAFLIGYFLFNANAESAINYSYCERDCKMEYNFFKTYARQGSSLANLSMAIMNYRGHGREINIPLANKLLIRAARDREPAAMYQLAYNMMYGLHMEQDLEQALVWFKKTERFNVLNTKRNVNLLTLFLDEEQVEKRSSMKAVFSKVSQAKEDILFKQENDGDIEHIAVTHQFYWDYILYNAELQTCTVNCLSMSFNTLVPLIHVVNEQALLTELELAVSAKI
ncbi:tetratricopeptide repeat protein [Colwellia hornerae]|uniref:Sel1 repeat family protein n=1 Tax=Colwellia hornerae TaxID=89402 RepID=A0A5C6Q349_9GAMM|nr:SEL1-like repeat protein [Colwellia hornerae]TWX47182.1 sel1 repeat family protein [Colwellia hornerae]TWX54484.1 sel1 repeat family protein [Colwellia hornerae]TWX63264.1 sel1 repeat family protein [Colwellia hornerae]